MFGEELDAFPERRLKTTMKLFDKIEDKIIKLKLIRRYRKQIKIEEIMEQWITKRILDGQEGRRNELIESQGKVEELKLFIEFIKKI